MTNSSFVHKTVLSAVALLLVLNLSTLSQTQPQTPAQKHDRARVVRAASLPALDGNRLRATLLEVHYGPGESSPPHSHPCAVMGYVVQGSIRTQVEGAPLEIYKAGEGFYELPGGIHAISANASSTEPAEFVAYFVCDHETPLSTDVPAQTSNR
jgi:quercetin dioxygenase-like cupin family protein